MKYIVRVTIPIIYGQTMYKFQEFVNEKQAMMYVEDIKKTNKGRKTKYVIDLFEKNEEGSIIYHYEN